MQLDLFADSRDVMLRNDLVEALRARHPRAGRKARAKLESACPQDPLLAPAGILIDQLGRRSRPCSDPLDAKRAVELIDHAVHPAAERIFGRGKAHEWLVPIWQALAESAAALPFDADAPETHSAGLLLRARLWHRAREATEAIPGWRQIPQPLAWMSEIAFELDGLDDAWPLLAELAWLDPVRFAALARHLASPTLARMLREFDRGFVADDDAELAWFPAWALIAEPELAAVLGSARTPMPTPPEQAAHVVVQLLGLERQGRHHEVVAKRKQLRALHEVLFERYMAARA